jgi:ComF family protein
MNFLRHLAASFSELLFPARCLGCAEAEQLVSHHLPLLCAACRAKLIPFIPSYAPEEVFPFAACSLFVYQEPVSRLLLRLKFNGDLSGLATIATLVHEAGAEYLPPEPDLMLPVPLHLSHLRWRGFNQAILLAKTCFPFWQEKLRTDLLVRHRKTVPQIGLASEERRSNLRGAFSVRRPEEISGRRILLVDDVFTTGSTLRECAETLLQAGAREIAAFTVARAGAST